MKVSNRGRVCDTASSIRAFRLLADKVATSNSKDVIDKIFNVLAGDLNITTVKHFLPDDVTDQENNNWKKLHNWKRWWTRKEHLSKLFLFSSNSPCTLVPEAIYRGKSWKSHFCAKPRTEIEP